MKPLLQMETTGCGMMRINGLFGWVSYNDR
jgi:hypothetical protein